MTARCFALIPAAGIGTRIGGDTPKQYRPVAGRTMIAHVLAAFAAVPRIERIAIVVAVGDRWFDTTSMQEEAASRVEVVRTGGATRAASVAAGLAAMRTFVHDDDWVLVHDAARCGITAPLIEALIDRLVDHATGGLLALPVDDTIKRGVVVEDRIDVACTVDREALWRAQTPQMFRYRPLHDALVAAAGRGVVVTDEAGAMEAAGHVPSLVRGSSRNFKVTTADDLAMMEALLMGSTAGQDTR